MQEKHLNTLIDFSKLVGEQRQENIREQKPKAIKNQITKLAKQNEEDLRPVLKDYERTPTADELTQMHNYAVQYRKNNKKASRREVRRAIQKKFNIRIYK